MDLGHLKNAILATHLPKRVVLLGDNVKDEDGYRAVLGERGASAPQMAAARSVGHNFQNSWYDWRSA